jgi:hypothetical protein
MSTDVRVEDRLDGADNFKSWKEREEGNPKKSKRPRYKKDA